MMHVSPRGVASPSVDEVPIGAIIMWPSDTPPEGWLLCDGKTYDRAQYPELFAVVGGAFGALDNRTFTVPDMRGRFPLGQDDMGGTSANRVTSAQADSVGGTSGGESVTVTISELPAHSHQEQRYQNTSSGLGATSPGNSNPTATSCPATQNTGGGSALGIMNPYLTLNFIIKAARFIRRPA